MGWSLSDYDNWIVLREEVNSRRTFEIAKTEALAIAKSQLEVWKAALDNIQDWTEENHDPVWVNR